MLRSEPKGPLEAEVKAQDEPAPWQPTHRVVIDFYNATSAAIWLYVR
jgi:hypothetical protein